MVGRLNRLIRMLKKHGYDFITYNEFTNERV